MTVTATTTSQTADPSKTAAVSTALFVKHNGSRYRTPDDLQATADGALQYLVIGGCLAEYFPKVGSIINESYRGDFVLLNNFDSLPEIPPAKGSQYDFQIIHIPLRTILGNAFFRLPDDVASHEEFLRQTQEYVARYLDNALRLNADHKLLTFVLGFLIPQQNPLGRFQPRYDLRNIMHFIERLNMFLAAEIARRENAYFVDVDQVSSAIGKKSCQDDMVWSYTHGTTLSNSDHGHDQNRIQPPGSMQTHYLASWGEFFEAVLHDIFAMYRTIRQKDPVKLIVVDLDDTLWRGVAAEGTLGIIEGWPMGFMEALVLLKKRGILLAIVSKNDEKFILEHWDQIVQGQIALSDFAAYKINFRSKVENLSDILETFKLLPQNVVMVDDNPVERAAIEAEVPGVRVLGRHVYYLKRVLLWAAETQQCAFTLESGRKTEMMQAQLQRESVREALPHEEFLRTLELRVSISVVRATTEVQMSRALELLNKTNQFNTTGVRYTLEECHQRFLAGRLLYVLFAEDRFTQYGLIGAAWVSDNCVDHMVMSCRALGLGIEDAFLARLADSLVAQRHTVILGVLQPTDVNLACRQLYRRNGFEQVPADGSHWSRSLKVPLPCPGHVSLPTV